MKKDEAIFFIKGWIAADEEVLKIMQRRGDSKGVTYYKKAIEVYQTALKALEAVTTYDDIKREGLSYCPVCGAKVED